MAASGRSSSICPACNSLQQTENEEDLKTTFVVPISTLEQSKTSCPTGGCGVLLKAIERCAPGTNGFSQNASVYLCRLNLTTHQETNVGVSFIIHDPHSGASQSVELFVIEGSFHPQWPCIMASQSYTNLLSEESLEFVQSCLQSCISNHEQCSFGTRGTFIPKRVLDLGTAEVWGNYSDPADLKLIETEDNLRDEPYVALSHRWGHMDTTFTTTLATIRQRQASIAFNNLSLVYQDAVMLLRRLGIRYLWIDSLCIIQDSAKDWQQESKKMAEVYSNALFTLARQCEDSFPRSISNLEADTYLIHSGESGLAVYARPSLLHIWSDIDEDDEEAASHFPLFSRAWIYQERLLSPRVLHVSNHEFSWVCKSLTTCQCRMSRNIKIASREAAYPYNIDEAFMRWFKKSRNAAITTSDDNTLIARKWHRVVEEYTALHLTCKSDRLIALQGCATVVEQSTGFRYLKGLWKETLVQDMLWTVHAAADRHVDLLAMPTWSWASVSSQALYQDIKTSYVQVEDSHNEDALLVVGKMLPARVVNNSNQISMHAELNQEYLMTSDTVSYNTWAVTLLFFPDVNMEERNVFRLRLARVWTNSHLEMEKLERLRGGRWDGEQDFYLVLCEDDGGGSEYHRVGVVVNHDMESDLLDSSPVMINWEKVENKRVVIK